MKKGQEKVSHLTLDIGTHTYKWRGCQIPGTTTVLHNVGLIDGRFFTDVSAWRGTEVHRLCQVDCEGRPEEPEQPALEGYLRGWRAFKRDTGWQSLSIEESFHSSSHGFAGTADRIGFFPDDKEFLTVLDIKTGVSAPWARYQTAAYILLAQENMPSETILGRTALHLRAKGTYQIVPYSVADLREDQEVFLSALTVYNSKQKGVYNATTVDHP